MCMMMELKVLSEWCWQVGMLRKQELLLGQLYAEEGGTTLLRNVNK
jgi:hypothetical protein